MSYPTSIPAFTTLASSDAVSTTDINDPQTEIVAIATALGVSPQVVSDTGGIVTTENPSSIANFIDNMAVAVKQYVLADYWYKAAVGPQHTFYANGGGANLPVSTAYLIGPNGLLAVSTSDTYRQASFLVPFNGVALIDKFYLEITATGSTDANAPIGVYLKKNGSTAAEFFLPSYPAPAGVYWATVPSAPLLTVSGPQRVPFAQNDLLTFEVFDNSTLGTGHFIGAVSIRFEETT